MVAIFQERDSPIFREESFEIFLRVSGRHDYWEFQGNAASVIYDAHIPRYSARRLWPRWSRWNAEHVSYRAEIEDGRGWRGSWFIEWRDLDVDPEVDPLEARLCRVADDQFLEAQQLSCWPPAREAFDEPADWARVFFFQPPAPTQ